MYQLPTKLELKELLEAKYFSKFLNRVIFINDGCAGGLPGVIDIAILASVAAGRHVTYKSILRCLALRVEAQWIGLQFFPDPSLNSPYEIADADFRCFHIKNILICDDVKFRVVSGGAGIHHNEINDPAGDIAIMFLERKNSKGEILDLTKF